VFLAEQEEALPVAIQATDIIVAPKADMRTDGATSVSGKTGAGVEALMDRISAALSDMTQGAGLATHARHRDAMQAALVTLQDAIRFVGAGSDHYDIAAEEIRVAIRSLEALVGRVGVENLLDEIFSSFCLGK
jgi:tRNA modification GTPase